MLWKTYTDSMAKNKEQFANCPEVKYHQEQLETKINDVDTLKEFAQKGQSGTNVYSGRNDECKLIKQALRNITGNQNEYFWGGYYNDLKLIFHKEKKFLFNQCNVYISWKPECLMCDD
jgi:hypothetical protein